MDVVDAMDKDVSWLSLIPFIPNADMSKAGSDKGDLIDKLTVPLHIVIANTAQISNLIQPIWPNLLLQILVIKMKPLLAGKHVFTSLTTLL